MHNAAYKQGSSHQGQGSTTFDVEDGFQTPSVAVVGCWSGDSFWGLARLKTRATAGGFSSTAQRKRPYLTAEADRIRVGREIQ